MENDYNEKSPNECLNMEYQTKKREFVQYNGQCLALQAIMGVNFVTEKISNFCPTDPYRYFDCDSGTSKCNYTAVDPVNQKACSNDFEGCADPDYLTDKTKDDQLASLCAARYEEWKRINPEVSIFTMIVYTLLIGIIILLGIKGRKGNESGHASSTWIFIVSLLFLIMMLGVSIMLLGAAYGQPWIPTVFTDTENFNPDDLKGKGIGLTVFFSVCIVLTILAFIRSKYR